LLYQLIINVDAQFSLNSKKIALAAIFGNIKITIAQTRRIFL